MKTNGKFPDFYGEYFCIPLIMEEIICFKNEHPCPFASMFENNPSGVRRRGILTPSSRVWVLRLCSAAV